MKKVLLLALCLYSGSGSAQNYIDNYLSGTPTYTTVANSTNQVNMPRDLDFKPFTNELWVVNKGTSAGGSMVIIYNAGQTGQTSQYRMDTHTGHFMIYPTCIAFGQNGNFANVNEIKSTAGPTSTFMGPALWTADTSIYARVFQNAWVGAQPLGSHLDMLHQSPFGMGIAHDTLNTYWVFDGHNSSLCKYDFALDHSPGYDDHSNGTIWRYSDVTLTRLPDVPGHLIKDKATGWLYIVDAGTQRLIRVNTTTETNAGSLTPPTTGAEGLAAYSNMTGATVEVIQTFTSGAQPSGVDLYNGRLIVGDHANGNIYVYDVTGPNPVSLGTIATGQSGMTGVKIGTDGKIWFVNYTLNTVVRIEPSSTPNDDAAIMKITSPMVNNHAGEFYSSKFTVCGNSVTPTVDLKNTGANTLGNVTIYYTIDGGAPVSYSWSGTLASGATTSVTLPAATVGLGTHVMYVYTSMPNGNADTNPANDKSMGSFRSIDPVMALPFTESFTSATFPPIGWTYMAHNFNNEMSHNATVGGFGTGAGCIKMDNFSGNTDIVNQKDYLILPRLNFSAASSTVAMNFHVAYAQYDANSTDALSVLVSTDCGNTWTVAHNEAGTTLSTAPAVTSAFTPSASQWKQSIVPLGTYAGQSDVLIAFRTTSGWGNNVFLDNINISNTASVTTINRGKFSVHPNPTNGKVNIELDETELAVVNIFDITGRLVQSETVNNGSGFYSIDISEQPNGIYLLDISSNGRSYKCKISLAK